MKNIQLLLSLIMTLVLFACAKEEEPKIMIENPPKEMGPMEDPEPTTQQDIKSVDDQIEAFMLKYDLPGASLAVTKNEKLVYAKGFGLANKETNESVTPDHSFRIASISKTFTATGILKLIEDGKLNLTDKVFGTDGILGDGYGSKPIDPKIYNITVNHLLYNTCGGWGVTSGGDPIDYEPDLDAEKFIAYVFDNWELKYFPGEEYSYSNTGYFLLARIIEKVSGKNYIDYLNDVLSPSGITSLYSTSFRESDLQDNEVRYYAQNDEQQWVYTIASRRDGDGGLVISAPDILRFFCAIDGFNNRQDVLSSSTLNMMTKASSLQENWGRGIGVWPQQSLQFSGGSLPGTRTWMMRGDNGISIAVLFNSRADHIQSFSGEFQALLLNILKDNGIAWQSSLDQF